MGVQSGGLASASQSVSWPALVAADAQATARQPLFRSPGCSPPLVAPLVLGRWLSGASTAAADTSCAGTTTAAAPPGGNLAIAGATAWDALWLTPKAVAAAPTKYAIADRQRYPVVLANTQSQVTAMLVQVPTFVAVELGLGEVIRAAVSGRVVTAESYDSPTDWTLAPAALFVAEFDAIADSLTKSGAKVVVLSVPHVTRFPAFRPASAIWAAQAALGGFGVLVAGDCATSTNVLHVAAIVPRLVQLALTAGVPQTLSCADVPGADDKILNASDLATIETAVDQINARLAQIAGEREWAFVDLEAVFAAMIAAAGDYSAQAQQTCVSPYGAFLSLDGIHPSAAGHRRVADAVNLAVNSKYGLALPIAGDPLDIRIVTCS